MAPPEAVAETPAAAGPGLKPSINQIASSLCLDTISVVMPLTRAAKVASASLSDTLVAIVIPSHQSVAPGIEPPVTVGAPDRTVFDTTSSDEPSSSRITPPREPHMKPMAALPASHNP